MLAVRSAARFISEKVPGVAVGLFGGMGAAWAAGTVPASRARASAPAPALLPITAARLVLLVVEPKLCVLSGAAALRAW
ncbi:hypothetical protein GCM10018951_12950 [Pseudarthrobacter polychromogenes]